MTNTNRPAVRVEIWSDVQCVWCYIGNARFQHAVDAFAGDVDIVYRSYELRPHAPVDIDIETHLLNEVSMPKEKRDAVLAQLAQLAAAEGLAYDPDRTQPTNSRLALELLHHADQTGQRPALAERLFSAYFAQGRHIGHLEELVAIAEETGLDPVHARAALTDHRHADAVNADVARLNALGVSSVPFYVIHDSWGISGAQPRDAILNALQAAARS